MKMATFILAILMPLIVVESPKADQLPFKLAGILDAKLKYTGHDSAAVSAAATLPFVLIHEGGGVYWLLDVKKSKSKVLTDNAISDQRVSAAHWSNDQIVLFFGYEGLVKRIDPANPDLVETIPAEIRSAPLRVSTWLDEQDVLIDNTTPYVMQNGVLTPMGEQHSHIPNQSGLVVVDEQRYLTSGFRDQTLKLWSLPDGALLNKWKLGRWYSPRRISDIAMVHSRLLVGSDGGRIEERSLENGEVLWSARPCRGSEVEFFYSSQQQSNSVEFRRVPSINVKDKIFYGCDRHFGTIQRIESGWLLEPLQKKLGLKGQLFNVEVVPNTNYAVVAMWQENRQEVFVLDVHRKTVAQQLKNTQDFNPGVFTYIAATRQLLLVGKSDELYLYDLKIPHPNKSPH